MPRPSLCRQGDSPHVARYAPVRAGGSSAEHGVTTGEHRRHVPALLAESFVADGVDASVDAMEQATRNAAVDHLVRQAELPQLRTRNDAVLPLRKRRDQRIKRTCEQFPPCEGAKCP